ncbi:MAG TPA: winged helix-turn-helix domain-containing protein [Candidatus Sulfotelmatobacter sp.]|jgi:TolB-like protein/DNA-binding winged helix-turn-helix (wHTH) protein
MLVTVPASRLLRFDNFELDLRAGELRKGGVKLRLQGQPIQVLGVLLNSPGDLVTREELRAQVWAAETFVDFDHSLHNAVARIRETLGDSAESPRYIETLPRRGYRFIGSVERVGLPEPAPVASTMPLPGIELPVPAKSSGKHSTLRLVGWAVLALVASLLVVAAAYLRGSAAPTVRSIAVLPLANFSGDPAQEYFADGMTDELITDLAKVSSLRVISRTSVMRYKGAKKSLPEIARELNVDGIIEGSVTRSGQRIRITAQLLYGPTDKHIWAETYERDLGDVLSLQSDVAQAIAQQVRVQLTPQTRASLKAARPVNPEAYDAYLRGRYYMGNDFTTAKPLFAAKDQFEEAVRKDPTFARAYSGLADAYLYLGLFRAITPEAADRATEDALQHALALDDSIGEAHDTLGSLDWHFRMDFDAAEREFDKSIGLAPSYSCAHEDRADLMAFLGRRDEARTEIAKSRELDPSVSSAITESGADYQMRDYDGLIEASRRGIAANPNEWLEHYYLGVGYEGTGKRLEAVSEYQRAMELSGGDDDAAAGLGYAYAALGNQGETRKILSDLEKKSKRSYVSPYMLAALHAELEEKDKALELLDAASRTKALDISWHLKSDPRMDNLRSDPRFENLLRRAGLN